jgi:hypothetical protein
MSDRRQGRFLGLPYDFRPPTRKRLATAMWNPRDRRLWMDKACGWGYDVNFAELWRRVGGRPR